MNREQCQKMCEAMNEAMKAGHHIRGVTKMIHDPNWCDCANPSGRTHVTSPIDQVESCSDCGKICKEDAAWLASESKRQADGNADGSSGRSAENADALAPPPQRLASKKDVPGG